MVNKLDKAQLSDLIDVCARGAVQCLVDRMEPRLWLSRRSGHQSPMLALNIPPEFGRESFGEFRIFSSWVDPVGALFGEHLEDVSIGVEH